MQRDGEDDLPAGAQAAGPSNISDVLAAIQLSDESDAQVTSFVDSLSQGLSGPRFRKLLTYILKFVELNRSKYETLRSEQSRATNLANSNRDELNQIFTVLQERLPPVATVPRVPAVPALAAQTLPATSSAMPTLATQPQATLPSMPTLAPQVSQATEPSASMASASVPVQPSAFQPLAPQATGMGYFATPATFTPSIPNPDGTVSRRMDQVGNNVIVTFSGNDDMASKKAKLFGSAAKYDIFTGQDMSKFPEWVAQFLSGVNLFQPTEPHACRIALHLLRDKAAEMSKNVSQNISMQNLQELLTTLDRIFNTSGNRIVAVGLFNGFTQREDMPVQDYAIRIEQLFYRAYPGLNPDLSVFLMDRFINGLISTEVKQKLRIPPLPSHFREAVEKAMSMTAAIYHGDQIMKQRSMAWKMAASAGNPLHTKSSRSPRGQIQMLDTQGDTPATIQVIRKWCTLHKTDKHSNNDCRAQKETAPSTTKTTSKKRPKGSDKRKAKPRKLKFKSTSDKKKFLRSIDDTEGVTIESASSDDEDVVEQSLMQLDPVSGGTSDEDEDGEGELHILMLDPDSLLDDPDIAMDSVLLEPNTSTETLGSGVSGIRLEGEKADSPMSMKTGGSPSRFSPLDTALLNTSMNTPVVPTIKDENNPFSPAELPPLVDDEEMFPALAPNVINPDAGAVESVPNQNYLLYGGVYYQPIPPPHSVVVTHSAIPKPDLIPAVSEPVPDVVPPVAPAEIPLPTTDTETNCSELSVPLTETPSASAPTDDTVKASTDPETQEGQAFAVPEKTSSAKKTRRKSRPRSRSSSSRTSESQNRQPSGISPTDSLASAKRVRGIGRGKAKEATSTVSTVRPLVGVATPRENLRITVPAKGGPRKVEIIPDYPANIAHLAPLENEIRKTKEPQLPSEVKDDLPIQIPLEDPHADSEIDMLTGEVQGSKKTPVQFSFQALSVLEDHQRFAQEVLKLEPSSWDRIKVESNPSLFYHAYFLDQQKLHEVRQRGEVRIQQFNVKVTRQPPDTDFSTSSRYNREKLEGKFKVAISNLYHAFEEAFQYESSDFIEDLSQHLVKNAVSQITSLFASSRCRTCHRGRRMDAAWRYRRFETLLPFLAEVPAESYRRAEDHRAHVLLDKTSLVADGPPMDKFRLGFNSDDRRTYASLTSMEKKSFDEELSTLAHTNSLMRMSRRWENCKFESPALDINLGHQAFQKMRQLRRQNLLPIAQMLLQRYRDRNDQLVSRFGNSQSSN